jgi:hypothetical protein
MIWVEGFSSWRRVPTSRSFAKQIVSRCSTSVFFCEGEWIFEEESKEAFGLRIRGVGARLWMEGFLATTLMPDDAEERRVEAGTGMLCCEAGVGFCGK